MFFLQGSFENRITGVFYKANNVMDPLSLCQRMDELFFLVYHQIFYNKTGQAATRCKMADVTMFLVQSMGRISLRYSDAEDPRYQTRFYAACCNSEIF